MYELIDANEENAIGDDGVDFALEDAQLLIRHKGGRWAPPTVSTYSDEAHLEEILANEPRLLPGIGATTVAVRQFNVPETGPVDILLVDQAGSITVCECKLRANSEIRRSIVGQVLAYASGLWRMTYEEFDAEWTRRHGQNLVNSLHLDSDVLKRNLSRSSQQRVEIWAFSNGVGRGFHHSRTARIVQYLNTQTKDETSVLAVELRYSRDGDLELLIPHVYGFESAQTKARPVKHRWTEAELVSALQERDSHAAQQIRGFLDHFRNRIERFYFGEGKAPSVTAVMKDDKNWYSFSVWVEPIGVSVNFEYMYAAKPEGAQQLLARLSSHEAFAPYLREVAPKEFRKRPTIPWIGVLEIDANLNALRSAFDELI